MVIPAQLRLTAVVKATSEARCRLERMGRSSNPSSWRPVLMSKPARLVLAFAFLAALAAGIDRPAYAQASKAAPVHPKGATCERPKFRVVLDVGHSAESPGAISARGVDEYDFNLRLAKLVDEKLRAAGFSNTVLQITSGQIIPSLVRRTADANKLNADLFLSIHHDSVPDKFKEKWTYEGKELQFSDRFKGHSIFISLNNRKANASLLFARLLGKQMKARGFEYTSQYTLPIMGNRRRELLDAEFGVYRFDELYVLKHTQMPAALIEGGSIINRDEELLSASEERQQLIAASVVDAVEEFCAGKKPR